MSFVVMKADLLTEKEKRQQLRKASHNTTSLLNLLLLPTRGRGSSRDLAKAAIPSRHWSHSSENTPHSRWTPLAHALGKWDPGRTADCSEQAPPPGKSKVHPADQSCSLHMKQHFNVTHTANLTLLTNLTRYLPAAPTDSPTLSNPGPSFSQHFFPPILGQRGSEGLKYLQESQIQPFHFPSAK